MKYFRQLKNPAGIKIIVGSACLWAWLDGLFVGAFFRPTGLSGDMPGIAAMLVFACSSLGFAYALWKKTPVERIISNKKTLTIFAVLGTVGSFSCILAGYLQSWPLVIAGSVLGGSFLAVFELGWGAAYSHNGARSAAPYIAGAFAFALIIDIPLFLMVPQAASFFFALLPLASGLFFVSVEPGRRRYVARQSNFMPPSKGPISRLRKYLGVSIMLLIALSLVMVGFGYMQHLVSFSPLASAEGFASILIVVVRGISAIVLFAAIIAIPTHISVVYRLGLLVMVAGFMVMPLVDANLFWISAALIIGGYTAFDILIWVSFSQIANAQSQAPLITTLC